MIDWVQAVIQLRHNVKLEGGLVIATDSDGVIQWRREKLATIEGSYDTKIAVFSQNQVAEDTWSEIYISGNPLKFLQGHNLFGSDDVLGLLAGMARKALTLQNIEVTHDDYKRWSDGTGVKLTMVDITYMWKLPNQADARAWLRALEASAHMKRRGQGLYDRGTVYFGKNSRRWAFKWYCKADEMATGKKSHALPRIFDTDLMRADKQRLIDWAQGTVRGELRILPMEMNRLQLNEGKWWVNLHPRELFNSYLEGLQMSEQKLHDDTLIQKLKPAVQRTYMMWKDGFDPRERMTKPTFYRHRKKLLDYGVDIALLPENKLDRPSNVVPILRPLEALPVGKPDFAGPGRHILYMTERDKQRYKKFGNYI